MRDHLPTLFEVALQKDVRLIVEIGVRSGQSTSAFVAAARHTGSHVLSCDVEATIFESGYERWHFIQGRGEALAHAFKKGDIRRALDLPQTVDVLFIDSSHLYAETVAQLRAWVPLLSRDGTIILHDTNMSRVFRKHNGGLGLGWNNKGAVVRAVRDQLGIDIDRSRPYVALEAQWLVIHDNLSSGLTVLRRVLMHAESVIDERTHAIGL